jgi:hypothetical protein
VAPLLPLVPELPEDDAAAPGLQRSSASCVQTCCSVCDVSNAAACVHVVYVPIEQRSCPHAQMSSVAPPLMRNPQCGNACVSTTSVGQMLVA